MGWSTGRGIGTTISVNGLRYWPGIAIDSPVDDTIWYPALGFRNGSGLSSVSSNGNYWSATPNSATGGYNLSFYSTFVNPSNAYDRYYGFAARCVAE